MRSSQDTAITGLDRCDTYSGDKSDAGIGSGRLGRLLCSYEFRFSVSAWNLFEIAVRDSDVYYLQRTVALTFDVHCACFISSFKTLFSILGYITLSFGRIWVNMGVVRHSAFYPMGTRDPFPGVMRQGREADYSPPSSAEVKNAWTYISTTQYVFLAWCLVKHRDNFFYFF
jgi:hypothetical protein